MLATAVGGVTDFVDAGTGRLCPAATPAALAAALTAQLAEPAVALARAAAARRRVEQRFDISRNVETMTAAWEVVAERAVLD